MSSPCRFWPAATTPRSLTAGYGLIVADECDHVPAFGTPSDFPATQPTTTLFWAPADPAPVLYVHPTAYQYDGDANPSRPGGMTAIYRHLAADEQRTRQVIADVLTALSKDRNCLVLTNRTSGEARALVRRGCACPSTAGCARRRSRNQ